MNIKLNPEMFGNMFAIPADVVDKHLKLCSEWQLKVLLLILRSGGGEIEPEALAQQLGTDTDTVSESVIYWQSRGVLLGGEINKPAEQTSGAVTKSPLPSRSEVAARMNESREIAETLRRAEQIFGRLLRQNELVTLVHLIDDEGINPAVLLMLIEHAAAEGKCTAGNIERTAVKWINKGIVSVADAERELVAAAAASSAWGIVCKAFGTDRRRPSQKEQEAADRWINDWHMSSDMLRLAYDRCVDAKGKPLTGYINTVLAAWHDAGYTTPAEVSQADGQRKAEKAGSKTSFDLSLFDTI